MGGRRARSWPHRCIASERRANGGTPGQAARVSREVPYPASWPWGDGGHADHRRARLSESRLGPLLRAAGRAHRAVRGLLGTRAPDRRSRRRESRRLRAPSDRVTGRCCGGSPRARSPTPWPQPVPEATPASVDDASSEVAPEVGGNHLAHATRKPSDGGRAGVTLLPSAPPRPAHDPPTVPAVGSPVTVAVPGSLFWYMSATAFLVGSRRRGLLR